MDVRVVKCVERQFIPLPEWGFFDENAFFLAKCLDGVLFISIFVPFS